MENSNLMISLQESETIWKFYLSTQVPESGLVEIDMPAEATILTVALQDDIPYIWAIVNPKNEKTLRTFYCIWTGQPLISINKKHIGTFQKSNGIVYHVFELL